VREIESPDELNDLQKAALHLDLLGALDALADHPQIDPSRTVVFGTGISTNAAVRCALENPSVRGLVLFVGLIAAEETEFLVEHPDLPLLIVADAEDRRGVALTRQYAARFTGPKQSYFELPPVDPEEHVRWRGTDGLKVDSGLADLILWFLDRTVSP
jgi:dienelactone hydrolase